MYTRHGFISLTNWICFAALFCSVSMGGRSVLHVYDNNGHLTNSIDVEGISSSFTYDTNDIVTGLTTPYGTTGFSVTDPTNSTSGRSVLVTQPDGGHQLYLFKDNAPGMAYSYPTNQIPDTTPFDNMFGNSDMNLWNSFYWGPRQYAALSTTNIAALTTNDIRKAQMRHWLISGTNSLGATLSMARDPSPDSAGAIEGQKTWYDYAEKFNAEYQGNQVMPLFVARVLPDGTTSTSFTRTARNSFGAVTNEVSTYSSGGSVALRTNVYVYDPNGIDLIKTTNALGVLVSSSLYNAYHEVVTNFDALGEVTTYTYDDSNRLTSITRPSGLVTTNIYGSDGFLAQQIDIGFATNNYTYVNDLVFTHTDARGLTTTNTWDNLNRLTSTAFPDGTAISYTYTNLDLIRVVDRMGFTNSFGYDNMRHKVAETNALGNPTLYNYCTCGSLNSILDAGNNLTQFSYDNQGNLTYTLYADNYSVTRTLNLLKQVVSTTDSSGYSVTNTYNNQGLIISVSNAFGRVQSTVYDALDRATNAVDANGVSINKTYDNLNRPLTRSYPDNGVEKWGYTLNVFGATSYTNQIGNAVLYGFDAMNRKTNEVYVGVTTNQFAYNGAGDLLTLTDGKNQPTTWGYDSYGRVSGVEVVGGAIVGTVSGVAAGVVVGITTENPYAGGTAGVIVGGLAGGRDIYGGSRMLGEGHERAKQILDTYNRCMAKCE
jgi:YD repeat-containing protein